MPHARCCWQALSGCHASWPGPVGRGRGNSWAACALHPVRSNPQACTRQPQQCLPAEAQAHPLTLTHARWELLTIVNTEINRRIASTTDEKLYGRVEYWTLPEVPLVSLLPAEEVEPFTSLPELSEEPELPAVPEEPASAIDGDPDAPDVADDPMAEAEGEEPAAASNPLR